MYLVYAIFFQHMHAFKYLGLDINITNCNMHNDIELRLKFGNGFGKMLDSHIDWEEKIHIPHHMSNRL